MKQGEKRNMLLRNRGRFMGGVETARGPYRGAGKLWSIFTALGAGKKEGVQVSHQILEQKKTTRLTRGVNFEGRIRY